MARQTRRDALKLGAFGLGAAAIGGCGIGPTLEEFLQGRFQEMSPEEKESTRRAALAISNEMLREGIELVSSKDMGGGAKVCLVGESLEIDLSEDTISDLILKYLLPRFRAILEGSE